jgi:hypothetical protein
MSRIFVDARNPIRGDEAAWALADHVVEQASWRERIAVFGFVGFGVIFWVAVVLAFVG